MRFILGVFVGAALMLAGERISARHGRRTRRPEATIRELGYGYRNAWALTPPLHPEYSEFRIDDRRIQRRRKRKRQYTTRF